MYLRVNGDVNTYGSLELKCVSWDSGCFKCHIIIIIMFLFTFSSAAHIRFRDKASLFISLEAAVRQKAKVLQNDTAKHSAQQYVYTHSTML